MSVRWKKMALTGWGRGPAADVAAARPERAADATAAVKKAREEGAAALARGAGRSYGDAAQLAGGRAILTDRLDRILAFDPATASVECEAGVTFRALLDAFLPRGFVPPVSPGTAFVTVGGAVAADVHGKNHDRHGSFGDHVEWLDVLLADGRIVRTGPDTEPDLFRATLGGMGLTGIVLRVRLRLLPGSPVLQVRETRIRDLDAFFAAFEAARARATYSVGWIDALASGRSLGRGIFETAEFVPGPAAPARKPLRIPFDLPGFALSAPGVRAFNAVYWRRVPKAGREGLRGLDTFFYPLDRLADWHRLYGRRGFYQFQSVVPDGAALRAVREMLETVASAGNASFLAVLKTLGGEGRGLLSFPMRGVTLALDIPRAAGAVELMARLERISREAGGRIYLAKDAAMSAATFAATYPGLPAFEAALARFDPQGRFASDQSRRLQIGRRAA
ncbi:MAG: FAD-binding oxidoreductase [Rhodospirillales bacterium]|nr:FAD-binding oxidoreductase [Rhodospirillales bacterium]